MQDKTKLLKKIQMFDFCLTDINLYLDSHPFCKDGLEYFNKYNQLRKIALEEYTKNYGPLTISDVDPSQYWTWAEGPWPWEKGE